MNSVASVDKYPWTQNTRKLQEFLERLHRNINPPDSVNRTWLEQNGFKSKNDRPFIKILQHIGFVDQSARPTDLWRVEYRGSDYRKALAKGIMQGYADLFKHFANPPAMSQKELEDFFATKTDAKEQVIMYTAMVFRTLCGLAEFNGVSPAGLTTSETTQPENDNDQAGPKGSAQMERIGDMQFAGTNARGVSITINIQLTLPEKMTKEDFANFFEAMKKNLLT